MPPVPKVGYGRTVTRTTTDAGQLAYAEDVFYNGAAVATVTVTIEGRAKDARKLWGVNVVSEDMDATQLNQQVDMLYDGQVVGRLSIVFFPPEAQPDGPTIYPSSIDTAWVADPANPAPAAISVART